MLRSSRRFPGQLAAFLGGRKQPVVGVVHLFELRSDQPGTAAWRLEVGGGDVVEEGVHLAQAERVVQRLQGADRWRPVLSN